MNVQTHWLAVLSLLHVTAADLGVKANEQPPLVSPRVRTSAVGNAQNTSEYSYWEPTVAVDPENSSRIVLAAIFGEKLSPELGQRPKEMLILTWQSEDRGQTWSKATAPFQSAAPPRRYGADPVMAFGLGKQCWLAACDGEFPEVGKPTHYSIKICLSEDGGRRWKSPITIAELDNFRTGKGAVDKPWLAIDNTSGKRSGTLYAAWSRLNYDNLRCELWCSSLSSGTRQFSTSIELGESVKIPQQSQLSHEVQLSVGRDGMVDAVWQVAPTGHLLHARSNDGAKTFGKPISIGTDSNRAAGEFPSLASTLTGHLAAAWMTRNNVYHSQFQSDRWCAPRPVDGDVPNGERISHPTMAATADHLWMVVYNIIEKSGRIIVLLYRSDDDGRTWAQDCVLATRTVSSASINRFSPGEYIGVAAAKDVVYATYILPEETDERAKGQLYVSVVSLEKR